MTRKVDDPAQQPGIETFTLPASEMQFWGQNKSSPKSYAKAERKPSPPVKSSMCGRDGCRSFGRQPSRCLPFHPKRRTGSPDASQKAGCFSSGSRRGCLPHMQGLSGLVRRSGRNRYRPARNVVALPGSGSGANGRCRPARIMSSWWATCAMMMGVILTRGK